MSASTLPDQTTPVTLRIQTDNPAAEVFLLDPQLQLVARGIGSLVTRQVPGVYKIRVRLGREIQDQLILLSGDTTESIKAPAFASAAPFMTTALTHEYHRDAARKYSEHPGVTLGRGSSIFVLVRYFTPEGQKPGRQNHPARGLSLRSWDGTQRVDLARESKTDSKPDAWAACNVQLAPGAYVLEYEAPHATVATTLIASANWQTQVFLIRSQPSRDPGAPWRIGVFETGTVLMSSGAFSATSEDLQYTELARIALADDRSILSDVLRELLSRKFTNPMAGIFGAHLMLLGRDRASTPARPSEAASRPAVPDPAQPFDPQLFDTVISNLRGLVGPTHPDVEALSLQCSNRALRTKMVFSVPPMLRRSWSLIVQASNDRPEILDARLWDRLMARAMTAPFLSWLVVSAKDRARVLATIREAVDSQRTPHERSRPSAVLQSSVEPVESIALESGARAQEPASEDVRRRLSLDLDIPRSTVDRLLAER